VLATLNLGPSRAPRSLLVEVLRRALLGGAEASRIGFPARGLGSLIVEPALRFLEKNGGTVETGAPVTGLEWDSAGRFAAARTRDGSLHRAGAVVLATPHREAALLLAGRAEGFDERRAEALAASPIVAVHLWFDRAVSPHAMAGLIDSPIHWVFDRGRMGGARPPGYVALVTSGADEMARWDRRRLQALAMEELHRFFPRARGASLRRARVLKERRATPAFGPDQRRLRPGVRTSVPNLCLAGDWTATGLPATLEGAAASGHRAAAILGG
jgi:phytoene dehydrogenase-like protein